MALKPDALTCWMREQTIEDLPSGLTLRLEALKDGARLVIAGRILPRGQREIVFDAHGSAVSVGPLLRKVSM